MINTVFGTKLNMTQAFSSEGKRLAATALSMPQHRLVRLTNPQTEGYLAVQLGLGRKVKQANKPLSGHLKQAKFDYQPQWLREVIVADTEGLTPGQELDLASLLGEGDTVTVTAVSKGKGFAGVVKRHGFAGGPKTHGQSDRHRAPGAIGQRTTPGRVYRGKKMAGRMGNETITLQNLKVLSFDPQTRQVLLSGPIPGTRGSLVTIRIVKKAAVTPVAAIGAETNEQKI